MFGHVVLPGGDQPREAIHFLVDRRLSPVCQLLLPRVEFLVQIDESLDPEVI